MTGVAAFAASEYPPLVSWNGELLANYNLIRPFAMHSNGPRGLRQITGPTKAASVHVSHQRRCDDNHQLRFILEGPVTRHRHDDLIRPPKTVSRPDSYITKV